MILFTILLIVLLVLLSVIVLTTAVGGAAFIIVFADLIVCVWLIVKLMKHSAKKEKIIKG